MSGLRAILVGVERYDAGDGWDFAGPARDVALMQAWLRDTTDAGAAVTTLVSPLAGGPVVADGLPTRATLYDLFTRGLGDGGDTLLVYWSGHGVVDVAGRRRVFCSDATRDDKRNVELDGLLAYLAGGSSSRFDRQLVLVDACQVRAETRGYRTALPEQTWPTGQPRHGLEQHTLFAASPGEAAENRPVGGIGMFTGELVRLLRETGATPADLDVGKLAEALDARFTELRLAGQARQTPGHLWFRSPSREGTVFGLAGSSPSGRIPLAGMRRLLDVMLDIEQLADTPRRQRIVMMLPADIRAGVDYSSVPREHLISLVRACERFRAGRAALSAALDTGLDDRDGLQRLEAVMDDVWPA